MLDAIKDIFKKLGETAIKRVDNNFSGPFVFATILAFWEIPVHLFFTDAVSKIKKIDELLAGNLYLPFGISFGKMTWIALAWIFWVFLFPVLSPFFSKWRNRLIEYSEAVNNYESYVKLVAKINELENLNKELVESYNSYNALKEDLKSKVNENRDAYKHILKLQSVSRKLQLQISNDEDQSIFNELYNTQDFNSTSPNVDDRVKEILAKKVTLASTLALLDDAARMYRSVTGVALKTSRHDVQASIVSA